MKTVFFKILSTPLLVAIVNFLPLVVDDVNANPSAGISVKTNSQGRVVSLSYLADPEIIAGSSCVRQVDVRGIISQVRIDDNSPEITNIQFQKDGERNSLNYNISRQLRNTPQIRSFLTSGKPVSITYQATGASCKFLWIESIQSVETQSQNTAIPY